MNTTKFNVGTLDGKLWLEHTVIAGDVCAEDRLALMNFWVKKYGREIKVTSSVGPMTPEELLWWKQARRVELRQRVNIAVQALAIYLFLAELVHQTWTVLHP